MSSRASEHNIKTGRRAKLKNTNNAAAARNAAVESIGQSAPRTIGLRPSEATSTIRTCTFGISIVDQI